MGSSVQDPLLARLVADGTRPRPDRRELRSAPRLASLATAGTRHVYADTADVDELEDLLAAGAAQVCEVDGNTANQPLVAKVAERYVRRGEAGPWPGRLRGELEFGSREERAAWAYAVLTAQVGGEMADAFGAGRPWEVSLQLHMDLGHRPALARDVARWIHGVVPSALIKVPFRPDEPSSLLVARDLQAAGIPVNVTSTFSARQAVVVAFVSDPARTNVFLSRINEGLRAEMLAEESALEAQFALSDFRERDGLRTQLIVASVHSPTTLEVLAGCDAFTAPCKVLREFLDGGGADAHAIESCYGNSYESSITVAQEVRDRLGSEPVDRMHRVEPELVDFLRIQRGKGTWAEVESGAELHEHFDAAGFGDVFYDPSSAEAAELRHAKLPDLKGLLVDHVAMDTLFSLHANADFEKSQGEIDAAVRAAS